VRGLLDMIARLVDTRRPGRLVACMDEDWRPAFRVTAIPSYKEHRAAPGGDEVVPPGLTAQIPVINEVLEAAGIACAGAAGYEADDVIGTLVARADGPVEVVTGDRDLFQVVDDARPARVLYTARGVGRLEVIDEAAVTERYQIPGRAYAEFAALRGDPSDGLPGVPGIGAKTAAVLVTRFGTVEAMLEALEPGQEAARRMLGSAAAKLAGSRDYLEAAMPVVRVATDAPVTGTEGRLPASPDRDRLGALSTRWGLGASLTRMLAAIAP
jgi:5'-3' exonuclease